MDQPISPVNSTEKAPEPQYGYPQPTYASAPYSPPGTYASQAYNARPSPDAEMLQLQQDISDKLSLLIRLQEFKAKRFYLSQFLWNLLLQVFGLVAALLFGVFAVLAWSVGRDANNLTTDGNYMASQGNDLAQSANSLARSANALAEDANNMSQKSLRMSDDANCLASASGLMDLIGFCQDNDATGTGICADLIDELNDYVRNMFSSVASQASSCFAEATSATFGLPSPSSSSSSSSSTATSGASPTDSSPPGGGYGAGNNNGLSSGAIAGIVIGSLIGAIFFAGVVYLPYQIYKTKVRESKEDPLAEPQTEAS